VSAPPKQQPETYRRYTGDRRPLQPRRAVMNLAALAPDLLGVL
jgi:hypothetical protein